MRDENYVESHGGDTRIFGADEELLDKQTLSGDEL